MTATNNAIEILTQVFTNFPQPYENKENFHDR